MAFRFGKLHRQLIQAASELRDNVSTLSFTPPVTHVYNPLQYAWDAHVAYLKKANPRGIRTLLMGMNPGINESVAQPELEHPKRKIEGFACQRSEVSGRRFWGLFQEKFEKCDLFFEDHFVANFCPLVFMEETGRNRTPDKLPKVEKEALDQFCQEHLTRIIEILEPEFLVGVGAYAEKQFEHATETLKCSIATSRILHPSPASPAANRDWPGTATQQLTEAGIWQ